MDNSNRQGCNCEKASCGRASTQAAPCDCGEGCDCSPPCECGKDCRCGEAE